MKNIQETVTDLEHDVEELTKLLAQATRPNVKNLLSREISQFQEALRQERSKLNTPVIENSGEGSSNGQSEQKRNDNSDALSYTSIMKYSFEQEGDVVKVYFLLDGIGSVANENITCAITETTFDLKIRGYQGKNFRFQVPRLEDSVDPKASKHLVKKNSIVVSLKKKKSKNWDRLHYKESAFKPETPDLKNEDPQAGLMNMMKKMYQEGDDDMKRTIAQAWTKSQDEKDKGMKF